MQLTRRTFVVGGVSSLAGAKASHSADLPATQNGVIQPALFTAPPLVHGPDIESDGVLSFGLRGAMQPYPSEVEAAKRILQRAPTSTPLEVMRYFERLPYVDSQREAYNAGWAQRWNPVIVAFFVGIQPGAFDKDETPWCAAFLNWCLARAGYRGGTKSSSSGSFRDAPGRTTSPSVGDIVVFKSSRPGCSGHVGLVARRTGQQILVLGGNQTDVKGHKSVNHRWLPHPNLDLQIHSFHKISAFRSSINPRPRCPAA
jgi:uncharacterized protein (TIGR02594 family)